MKNSASMRVGLFGGAFDPVHLGHQQVVKSVLEQDILDEVWFVPVFTHPWAVKMGKEHLSAYEDRVKMIELAIENLVQHHSHLQSRVKIVHFKGVSFTYDILSHFANLHPEHQFFWVMGSEYLSKFDLFLADHPKLVDFPFYIYPRHGFAMKPLYPNMIALKGVEEVQISSTQIRQLASDNSSISDLVPTEVAKYIQAKKLYI